MAGTPWPRSAPTGRPAWSSTPRWPSGSLIGKRFADADSGLELLVTKAGAGTLALDGVAIPLKEAKPLPSSD